MSSNSRIVIGCMSWGQWGKKLSTNEQAQLIEFCTEQGNTTFDHADIYGNYTTEREFGNALQVAEVNREDIQLISKCGIQLEGHVGNNSIKHYDYSRKHIIDSVEASLINLKTDYLDTFLLHRPSPLMQVDEIAEAIAVLKDSGKIVEFGVSNFTTSQIELLKTFTPISTNQIEFSLTQHQAMHNGVLDYLRTHSIVSMSYSPLGTVFREQNTQTNRILPVLLDLSKKYGVPEESLLLNWILMHPAQISPVIGTTQPQRIQYANKALTFQMELEDWFLLLKASTGQDVA